MKFTPGLGLVILSIFVLAACTTSPRAPSTHQLVDEARQTVQNLKARKDLQEFAPMLKSAAGVAVFPAVYKAGFVVGAEVGNGVVLARDSRGNWGYPAFYTLGAGSFGFQAGVQQAEVVFILRSRKAVEAIIKHQGKFGADAGIAVGFVGSGIEGSTTSALGLDIVAFTGAKGLFGGAGLEGAAMVRRNDYNRQYYGQQIVPADVLLRNKYRNNQADPLRESLVVR